MPDFMTKSPTLTFKSLDTACIITNLLTYRIFTRIPSLFPRTAGSAAAVSALYSAIIAFLIIWIISTTFCRLSHKNILDTAGAVFGKIGRKLIALIILFYLGISSIIALGEFSEFTKLVSFPTAPLAFCAIFFFVAATLGAFGGFNALSRMHRLFIPLSVSVLTFVVISTLWKGDLSNLFPILGRGAENVFGKGISGVIMYTDITLLFLIAPSQNTPQENKRTLLTASAFSFLIVIAVMFAFTVRIPYPISAEGQFPVYLLFKQIHYGRFFQRIDAILLFAATLSGMLYLSLNLFFFTNILRTDFGLSDTKPVIFPLALAFFFCVAGVKFISAQTLNILLFCTGFGVLAASLVTILFTKVRKKLTNEKI